MIYLRDVNVWVALASRRHKHNKPAAAWMQSVGDNNVAFCRITELGLLRLLTNAHVMGSDVFDVLGAWGLYDTIRADPPVVFLSERAEFDNRWSLARSQIAGGSNAVTDSYLAVFAKHVDATVVTFDRGFKAVGGCSIALIP